MVRYIYIIIIDNYYYGTKVAYTSDKRMVQLSSDYMFTIKHEIRKTKHWPKPYRKTSSIVP
jgi:hypothetical protein